MTLDRITLGHFRNHAASRLDGSAQLNLLVGENGAGKTNVLEALSLLAPGPGPAPRRAGRDGATSAARARSRSAPRCERPSTGAGERVMIGTGTRPTGRGGAWSRSTAPRRAR